MCLYFGGRVAESLVFNRITTQSEQDLKKITNLAYAQVESFGMNDVRLNKNLSYFKKKLGLFLLKF